MPTAHDNTERDQVTLDQLIQGHPDGLRRLLSDHGGVVRAYLVRKFADIFDHWEIDEAMSLAAIRVWQSAPRFDASLGRLRAWFAVIARNCAMKLLAQRNGERLVPIDCIDASRLGLATSFSEAERLRLIVDVHRCIDELPRLQRAVLLADLNAGAPLAAPVLAERFGTTIQSVWVSRSHGRRTLRAMLARLGYGPDLIPERDGTHSRTPEAEA